MVAMASPTELIEVNDSSTIRIVAVIATAISDPTTGMSIVMSDPNARSRMIIAASTPTSTE